MLRGTRPQVDAGVVEHHVELAPAPDRAVGVGPHLLGIGDVGLDRDSVAAKAREIGAAAVAVQADISHPEQLRAYTDGTVGRWGKLDVVFNNAGVNLRACSTKHLTR